MTEILAFVQSAASQIAALGIDDPGSSYVFGLPETLNNTAAEDLELAIQLIRRAERRIEDDEDDSIQRPETLPYTAIGYWDDDHLWVTGVVRGIHDAGIGGDSPGTEEGAWAEHFHAAGDLAAASDAELLAQRASGMDDDEDDNDSDRPVYYSEEAVEVKAANGSVLGLVDITGDGVYLFSTKERLGWVMAEGPRDDDGWVVTTPAGKTTTTNTREGGLRVLWDDYLARTIAEHQSAR